jgi:tetratricopeptide (TPR) repeat protein
MPTSELGKLAVTKALEKIEDDKAKIKCLRALKIINEGTSLFASSPRESVQRLNEALNYLSDIPEAQSIRAFCYVHIGAAYGKLGELSQVIAFGEKALYILRDTGEIPDQAGLCLFNMGTVYCKMEKFEKAIDCLNKATAKLSGVYGQEERVANCKNNLLYAERMLKKRKGFFSRMLYGKAPSPAPQKPAPARKQNHRGLIGRFLGLFRNEPAVQTCETCSQQMEVFDFSGRGNVMLSAKDLASGIGQAEQCWECGRLYCAECYPSRTPNTCACGRGRDAVRHVGGTVYRGSLRLVKVRYIS